MRGQDNALLPSSSAIPPRVKIPGISGNFKTMKYLLGHFKLHLNIADLSLTPFLEASGEPLQLEEHLLDRSKRLHRSWPVLLHRLIEPRELRRETLKVEMPPATGGDLQPQNEGPVIWNGWRRTLENGIREDIIPLRTAKGPIEPHQSRRSSFIWPSKLSPQQGISIASVSSNKQQNLPIKARFRFALFSSIAW